MTEVYEVRHRYIDQEDDTHFAIIGVFSTRQLAEAAIARAKDEPIFKDVLGEFVIYPWTIDESEWDTGFFSIEDEPPVISAQESTEPRN
jgi:hypothetical protein